MSADPRIPVLRAGPGSLCPTDAVLLPPGAPAPPGYPVARLLASPAHVLGCACCPPRGEAGRALGRLFLARARGEVTFFDRVLVLLPSDAAWAEVVRAVSQDVLASARYRLAEGSKEGVLL